MKHIQEAAAKWAKDLYNGQREIDQPTLGAAFMLVAELSLYCRDLELRLEKIELTRDHKS